MQGYNCIIVYSKDKDRVLFCERLTDPYKDKFNLVGGKINKGEDGFDAAYRELLEETGISKMDVELHHMMDFTYYNQNCYVEVYVGVLEGYVHLIQEKHPLHWLPVSSDFFDLENFAGEGNIGHMMEQVKQFGPGVGESKTRPIGGDSKAGQADAAVEPITVLCYGDSNTYGYDPISGKRHGENVRWPMVLQKLLGSRYRIVEEGCNGRTVYNEVEDAPWKTGPYGLKTILNSHKPINLLVFMLGTNDLKNLYDSSAQNVADAMLEMMNESAAFLLEQQEFVPEFLLIAPPEISDRIEGSPFGDEFDSDSADRSMSLATTLRRAAMNFNFEGKRCHFLNAAAYVEPSKHDCLHLDPDQHHRLAKVIYEKIDKEIATSGLF